MHQTKWQTWPRTYILAHRIRVSEILPRDRKSYLSHAILPSLSCEGSVRRLCWNSRTWSSSDVIVMLKCRHHVQLHLSVYSDFWKLILKQKRARKAIHNSREGRIEKNVSRQAFWCQTVILGTDFSILPSHAWIFYSLFGLAIISLRKSHLLPNCSYIIVFVCVYLCVSVF